MSSTESVCVGGVQTITRFDCPSVVIRFFGYLTVKTSSVIVMESCGSCVKKEKKNKENKTNDPNYKPKHKGSTHKLTPRYGQYLSQVLS